MISIALPVLILLSLLNRPAAGHGGEDHGAPAGASPVAPAQSGIRSISDVSDTFELLAQHEKLLPGKSSTVQFYLSEFRTNRPVGQAKITLEMAGPAPLTVTPTPGSSPGEYVAKVIWPVEGEYVASVTIETKETTDPLLSLNSFKVGERFYVEVQPEGASRAAVLVKVLIVSLLAGVAALIVFVALRRRRAPSIAATLIAFLVTFAVSRPAQAHGGEDHGEQPPSGSPARSMGDALIIPKVAQFLLGIETDLAEKRRLAPVVKIIGRIEATPDGEAKVLAPYDGVLSFPRGRFVRPGMGVRAGETLAFLAPSFDLKDQFEFTSRKRETEAAYRKAESTLHVAQANWERAQQLQLVLSQRERQEIEAVYNSSVADFDAAGKLHEALEALEKKKEQVAIISPIEGAIVEVQFTVGNVVQKGAELFRVIDPKKLLVHGEAYENQLGALATATDGWFEVPALGKRYPTTMLSRGLEVDPATRTAHVYFSITDPGGLLIPHLTATLYIRTGRPEETLAVPRAAVVDVEGKTVVFVHVSPEEFRAREVETGWTDEEAVEVVRGLREGERVVVKGNYELRSAAAGKR